MEISENLQPLTRADMLFYNASLYGELNFAVAAKQNHSSITVDIPFPFTLELETVLLHSQFALQLNEDGKYIYNYKCCFKIKIIKSCKLDNQSSVIVKKENIWIAHD